MSDIPKNSYGVLRQDNINSEEAFCKEEIYRNGYSILDSGLSKKDIDNLANKFNDLLIFYTKKYGRDNLKNLDEHNTIRCPLAFDKIFLDLALNKKLISLLKSIFTGRFLLNQQNGIINPSRKNYNQQFWHRDIPYQHFTTSKILAINALFCLDDFTDTNGSTYILPSSHKFETLPSDRYIENNAIKLEAKAGQFIILDCMTYHSGSKNISDYSRRAINHVFSLPFIKQQINLSNLLNYDNLTNSEKEYLGFGMESPKSLQEFFLQRGKK